MMNANWCQIVTLAYNLEQGIFERLMERLRAIAGGAHGFAPVAPTANASHPPRTLNS